MSLEGGHPLTVTIGVLWFMMGHSLWLLLQRDHRFTYHLCDLPGGIQRVDGWFGGSGPLGGEVRHGSDFRPAEGQVGIFFRIFGPIWLDFGWVGRSWVSGFEN